MSYADYNLYDNRGSGERRPKLLRAAPAGGCVSSRPVKKRSPQADTGDMVFPTGNPDEREMLLMWLDYLRGAVIRKVEGLNEDDARWTPEGRLSRS